MPIQLVTMYYQGRIDQGTYIYRKPIPCVLPKIVHVKPTLCVLSVGFTCTIFGTYYQIVPVFCKENRPFIKRGTYVHRRSIAYIEEALTLGNIYVSTSKHLIVINHVNFIMSINFTLSITFCLPVWFEILIYDALISKVKYINFFSWGPIFMHLYQGVRLYQRYLYRRFYTIQMYYLFAGDLILCTYIAIALISQGTYIATGLYYKFSKNVLNQFIEIFLE